MDIRLYCNDGSPLEITPDFINGRGVGGAELSMMIWARTMVGRGHNVTIYNNPPTPGEYDGVTYQPQAAFNSAVFSDVFITYRSPNPYTANVKTDFHIHWSTDQYTIGNFATEIFPFVNKIVCISPYHVNYHKTTYGAEDSKIGYMDLGVTISDYDQEIERIKGRCIFCSIPDRGLDILRMIWPTIKEERPDASLVITSDYRLWGVTSPGNQQHRMEWLHQDDVIFLGKIGRQHLIQEQLAAQVMSYPCTYEELFCISAAECQVAGAYPVTNLIGALATTNEFGTLVEGSPIHKGWRDLFAKEVIEALDITEGKRDLMRLDAARRFDWDIICGQWEQLIETGEFVDARIRV